MAIKTLNSLYRKYVYLNNKYWNGKLPPVEIELKDLKNTYGEYFYPKNIENDISENYKIIINARLHWRYKTSMRNTLLHEMCHHAIFLKHKNKFWNKEIRWHGKEWKREMERVGFKKPILATT